MLAEVISTAGPNHINCNDSYNFMTKINWSLPLSNVFNSNILYMYSYLMRIPLHCNMKTAEQKHVSYSMFRGNMSYIPVLFDRFFTSVP